MSEEKNKITYGLKNVVVWPITSTSAEGKPTYGTQIKMPGATEISVDAKGSSEPFYADDIVYTQNVSNSGYTGKLKMADVPAEFLKEVMGEKVDKNGAMLEFSDALPKEFAMAFEFKGDVKKRRHLLYRCTATRPAVGSKTKEDKINPNTPEINYTAMPRLDNGLVKSKAEETDTAYKTWFGTTPYEPDLTAEASAHQ